jgi:hypothetical protein
VSWLWDSVEIRGEKEFLVALGRFEATLENMGEEAGYRASKIIADSAARKMPVGPAEGGHVRSTARAERSGGVGGDARGPSAVIGGTRFPYVGWLEFGGRVGKVDPPSGRFGIWRQYMGPTGRYLYPSYIQHTKRVDQIQDHEMVETARRAGLEVDS